MNCCCTALTAEQRAYWDNRRKKRERVDLRGQDLHSDSHGGIVEIEEALQKYWVDWQDSPDEIVVDDLIVFYQTMSGTRGPWTYWHPMPMQYLSKYSIDPNTKCGIPVFENI